jgi:putative endonuclease
MKVYFVYILQCADESYYTGITNNLERRVHEHNYECRPGSYIYSRRPAKLVFCEQFQQVKQAIAFEKQIKNWSHKKKKALIEGKWDVLRELSKCQNATVSVPKK